MRTKDRKATKSILVKHVLEERHYIDPNNVKVLKQVQKSTLLGAYENLRISR